MDLEYVISKTSATHRNDGAYEYLMIHLALELPSGEIELSDGMIVARDFVLELMTQHDIEFYTVETNLHNKKVGGFPVFVEDNHLKVTSNDLDCDDLGELDTFLVEVTQ